VRGMVTERSAPGEEDGAWEEMGWMEDDGRRDGRGEMGRRVQGMDVCEMGCGGDGVVRWKGEMGDDA